MWKREEPYLTWQPPLVSAGAYTVRCEDWAGGTLCVQVQPTAGGEVLELRWEEVCSCQVTQEECRKDWWRLHTAEPWAFWRSEDSGFLRDFCRENALYPEKLTHFVVAGTNQILDVLAPGEPVVRRMPG